MKFTFSRFLKELAIAVLIAVGIFLAVAAITEARGSSGGRSSSSRSSSSRSSSSSSKSSSSKSSSSKPPVGKSTAKPGSSIKTKSGKTVKSSTKTPKNSTYKRSTGIVGDNGYSPRFAGGYSAPAGSVVYYPQNSALDYFFLYYLFSNSSPRNDKATVVEPSGKEKEVKPVKEGVDGWYIFNWFVMIVLVLAGIGGVVYLVNRKTS